MSPDITDCIITTLSKNTLLGSLLGIVRQYKSFISSNRSALDPLTDKWDIVLLGGIMGSIFSFLQFLVSPYIGKLSDQIGRRKTLLLTMVTIIGILEIDHSRDGADFAYYHRLETLFPLLFGPLHVHLTYSYGRVSSAV
jgi:MFS family permease